MAKISAGSYELDKFLEGGYETDIITTIYGPAGSGKTNFCMLAAAKQAREGKKVIFIDTEGGFSIERLKQIIGENEKNNEKNIMNNILLLKATNFAEQREAFNKLLTELKREISLIVVDGMTMLYRLELGAASSAKDNEKVYAVNRALVRQLRILAEIARKKNIPVLVTNQVYAEFSKKEQQEGRMQENKIHMVGGDILKYWSKCLVELQNLQGGRKKVILRKHRSLPEKELVFVITNDGIRKARRFF